MSTLDLGYVSDMGSVQSCARTSNFISVLLMGVILMEMMSCADESDSGDCFSNVDCAGRMACVQGKCVGNFTECEMLGAFQPIVTHSFSDVNRLEDGHTFIDEFSTVHYCYDAYINGAYVSRYGKQTSSFSFNEIPIQNSSYQEIHCNALAISSDGTPFVLDKHNALVLYRINGAWRIFTLREIETNVERADLAGNDTVIHMTPDNTGGMYVGISMGYTHTEQKVYLAHATSGGFELLKNGLRDTNVFSGHAPQFAPQAATSATTAQPVSTIPYYVTDDLKHSVVSLNDSQIGSIQSVEGGYPRVDLDEAGYLNILYVDTNYFLRVARMQNGHFLERGTAGQIDFDSPNAQIPWVFDVRPTGTSHILYEDNTQGYHTLSYRKVTQDNASDISIITTALTSTLNGSQKYAIHTDLCRRATVAVFEEQTSENIETGTLNARTVLTIKAQR